ncbi:MAG: NAD(P)/FAD-dependent oxidoreductase [Anaerolineae bacterium]|nr:FAD-dependent oxidoreductase [Chloroflexota bacterium]
METRDVKYLIIGGGVAAARACAGIRALDEEGSIAILTEEPHLPYHRPPLSKGYLRGDESERVIMHPAAWYRRRGIAVYTSTRATRISRRSRRVTLADGSSIGYEELLLATGGRAWRLPLAGADLAGVYTLRTMDDADDIREAASTARHAVVIGGSFIGTEISASLAQMGVPVTMCFLEEYPLQGIVPEELGLLIRDRLAAQGVVLIPQMRPERIEGEGHVEAVRLENGMVAPADLVVMGVGIRLNTELAREAELELTDRSGVVVDERLRTSDPHIYAAGDIAAWPDARSGERVRAEHWDTAYRQGYAAGRSMAGSLDPYDAVSYVFSDILDLSLEAWGDLTRQEVIIKRGSPSEGSVTYFYVKDDAVDGVLAVGLPEQERNCIVALIKARPSVAPIRCALADETVSLEQLIHCGEEGAA